MRPEYDLDWSKARRNPYAARLKDTIAVVLEPDVAQVFQTSDSVNALLRSVIAAVPKPGRRPAAKAKAQPARKAG